MTGNFSNSMLFGADKLNYDINNNKLINEIIYLKRHANPTDFSRYSIAMLNSDAKISTIWARVIA